MTTPDPCAEFERTTHAVLDGAQSPASLADPHPAGCPRCGPLAAAVRALAGGLEAARTDPGPGPPPGFAVTVVAAALRERRARQRRRLAAGLALAAGVALAAFAPRPGPNPELVQSPTPPAVAPVRVADRLAEAGTALAALTARTAEETVAPTRVLVPVFAPPEVAPMPVLPAADPAVESLAALPGSAQAGIEPVAETARRAVNLFLRDVGLAAAKPSS